MPIRSPDTLVSHHTAQLLKIFSPVCVCVCRKKKTGQHQFENHDLWGRRRGKSWRVLRGLKGHWANKRHGTIQWMETWPGRRMGPVGSRNNGTSPPPPAVRHPSHLHAMQRMDGRNSRKIWGYVRISWSKVFNFYMSGMRPMTQSPLSGLPIAIMTIFCYAIILPKYAVT